MDRLMKDEWNLDKMKWIQETIPIKSFRDVALGIVVGKILRFAREVVLTVTEAEPTVEDESEIRGMLKRRIPEISDRITLELSR